MQSLARIFIGEGCESRSGSCDGGATIRIQVNRQRRLEPTSAPYRGSATASQAACTPRPFLADLFTGTLRCVTGGCFVEALTE